MRRREINHAARMLHRRMKSMASGKMPRSFAGWKRLCESFGLRPVPLYRDRYCFTACLIEWENDWFAFFNHHASARRKMKYLCHELAEYLCQDGYASIFDLELRGYSGGSDPHDSRHRIAKRVEELCFRY